MKPKFLRARVQERQGAKVKASPTTAPPGVRPERPFRYYSLLLGPTYAPERK